MRIIRILIVGVPAVIVAGFLIYLINSYDFTPTTKENPFGIEAKVVYGKWTTLSCIRSPCELPYVYKLQLASQKGSEVTHYQICNGIFCMKDDASFTGAINVRVENPKNVTGPTAMNSPYVVLKDFPWKVGDTVRILVHARSITLLESGDLVKDEKSIFIDLGNSKIVPEK